RFGFAQEANDLFLGKALLHVQSPRGRELDSKLGRYSKLGGRRYNPKRRHGSIGDLSPVKFERRYAQRGCCVSTKPWAYHCFVASTRTSVSHRETERFSPNCDTKRSLSRKWIRIRELLAS
ncbi:hypothetical protein KRM18_23315, partial [Xanthomonas hortorum pv. gardneri]|uniref:hypothetical protein n=1 Tax=Xanthomonas hortorum TaxID=56454 RepID=UPI002FE1304B